MMGDDFRAANDVRREELEITRTFMARFLALYRDSDSPAGLASG
jgi:hypothetical protein